MIKYIFCILIGIFFVYGAGYTASIEETAELPAEVTATFVSQYAGDHSLFNDETAESKVCDAILPHSSFSRKIGSNYQRLAYIINDYQGVHFERLSF